MFVLDINELHSNIYSYFISLSYLKNSMNLADSNLVLYYGFKLFHRFVIILELSFFENDIPANIKMIQFQ